LFCRGFILFNLPLVFIVFEGPENEFHRGTRGF